VVAKFAGLGSILHTTPLLRALAASFPQARVTFATTRPHADLARRLEGVHDVVALEDASLPRLLASGAASLDRLTRPAADLYFDLEPHSALATAVSLLCLPRLRLAQSRSDLPHKASSGACLLEWGPRDRIREVWLELARRAGAHVDAGSELSAPRVTAADRDASRQALAACGMRDATRYLVVNPNASDLRLERRWPAESFAALIAGVAPACPVVLVGTEAERAHVSRVLGGVPEAARAAVFDTSGRLGIGALIALIEGAAAVVSNDSGPMHLGLALGVPTVCLFGPCQPDPYVAPGPRAAVFYERQPCSPCVHAPGPAPCGGDNVCMKAIGVAAVLAATRRLLQA
jgi:ADP-heptose:LPS heptosyltransferase